MIAFGFACVCILLLAVTGMLAAILHELREQHHD